VHLTPRAASHEARAGVSICCEGLRASLCVGGESQCCALSPCSSVAPCAVSRCASPRYPPRRLVQTILPFIELGESGRDGSLANLVTRSRGVLASNARMPLWESGLAASAVPSPSDTPTLVCVCVCVDLLACACVYWCACACCAWVGLTLWTLIGLFSPTALPPLRVPVGLQTRCSTTSRLWSWQARVRWTRQPV
jgi:hypothetical protein